MSERTRYFVLSVFNLVTSASTSDGMKSERTQYFALSVFSLVTSILTADGMTSERTGHFVLLVFSLVTSTSDRICQKGQGILCYQFSVS